jgi:hypothetical protein
VTTGTEESDPVELLREAAEEIEAVATEVLSDTEDFGIFQRRHRLERLAERLRQATGEAGDEQ